MGPNSLTRCKHMIIPSTCNHRNPSTTLSGFGAPHTISCTVYPKKYAHGYVVLCFVVVIQSFIMNSHEVFIHIHQGCFAGTGAIVRLPQCQWSKPDGYGKISQCITTTKHSKAKTVCIFLGIYCRFEINIYGLGQFSVQMDWMTLTGLVNGHIFVVKLIEFTEQNIATIQCVFVFIIWITHLSTYH